ncbi:sulfurtransferase [Tamlana sp. 2201CG12-4]|uniref:sulfurtransferase n=1 Tax=Tamlana sp. 2201CG12-4 TaxID=3112582 RepID=UPI002DB5651F|nr:sulfurtransferase [Tamlana sp. 2201CG12-4]MEC3907927.1 sulfurtransferase [Tamlana sp. 2201CG12-4]
MNISIATPVVSIAWLYEHLNAENLVVLDGTINKVFDVSQNQILHTRFFDIKKKFSDASNPFPNAFPSKEQFEKEARALGISGSHAIVVYDDKGMYSSARVWWLFKAFGYDNIAVLNGGFPAWEEASYPIESMREYQGPEGDFRASLQSEHMMFFEDVKSASKSNTHTIIDARSADRFNCETPEPRAGLRMGTIPGSLNLPFTDLLEGGLLKPKTELEKAFQELSTKEDAVIFSCGSGITACILALGAEISGYKNISVYDGSWTEYGSLTTGDMENPKTWTKDELLAYILIYVSNLDLNESGKETAYILSRVDKEVYERVRRQFKKDSDYQNIQKIIQAVKAHNYYRNDLADLFADIKLIAFADGDYDLMERMLYRHLKKILKDG